MVKTLFISISLVLLLHFVSFAQDGNNVLPKKIAFVNEFAFGDKTGIKKLNAAYNQMGMMDCSPPPCDQKFWEKREKILVEPILKEISDSLKQVEIQNNIIILRMGENNQIIVIDEKFDITKQFIAYFNNKSDKSNATLLLDLPNSKIGLMNTELFFDKDRGIKKLIKLDNSDSKQRCVETSVCMEIGKFIQSYAAGKGFSSIFDSSQNLPEGISEFKAEDVTQDFIFEYNKKFPK